MGPDWCIHIEMHLMRAFSGGTKEDKAAARCQAEWVVETFMPVSHDGE
jgi:hypothetical protein